MSVELSGYHYSRPRLHNVVTGGRFPSRRRARVWSWLADHWWRLTLAVGWAVTLGVLAVWAPW